MRYIVPYGYGMSAVLVAVVVMATQMAPSAGGSAGVDLRSLEAEFYRWREMDAPEFTTETGVHTYDNTVEDFSMVSLETRKAKVDDFISRLSTISTNDLTTSEKYSYEVFNDTLFTVSSNHQWRFYGPLNPLNFLEGDQIDPAYSVRILKYETKEDYEKFLSRLQLWPTKFDQYITRFKEATKNGHTYHRVSVDKLPGQIQQLLVANPETSAFYKPLTADLDKLTISTSDKADLRTRGRQAVVNLLHAFKRIKDYIEQDYMSQTRTTYGVLGLPKGIDLYRACLKWHISVDLTPEEVHEKGREEVARISSEIQIIMRKRNYTGTVAEFYKQLKEQPQFHLNSAEELLKEYRHMVYERIYPQLSRAFKNIPNLNVSVEAMPNDGTGGKYIAGTADGSRHGVFQVNLKRPNETNTFSMMALTLHETVPGHHLQSVYALTASLPDFQRNIEYEKYFAVPYHFPFYTAYTEGWGLYSESLGEYLGIYKDDNEMLGRYGEEIFRACRLVVDTGIHYFGWTRQEAITYMADHTPIGRTEIESEIDRYITLPGQACAYKIGELKIKELRQTARRKLGSKFDIGDFHSQILENGPVPLSLLEKIVNNWITEVSGNVATSSGGGSM
ncbi:uncharacterized protein LOC124263438 isoform X1 [Haliotis rubra]|uniref:uncharacterized protein LOC124263438 isoform X1 n=1 Tax=Haliotis rubra TaxID=36100 RepID=UPI001EE55FD3|nr:uncharacterized protein LOC124263438 isoform X1 [Haliotis rubra]